MPSSEIRDIIDDQPNKNVKKLQIALKNMLDQQNSKNSLPITQINTKNVEHEYTKLSLK
jgi:hypothetical protein